MPFQRKSGSLSTLMGDILAILSGSRANPQTWTRLKRIELRELAADIGNEAVLLLDKWPSDGQGREIKAMAERISKALGGTQHARTLKDAFDELIVSVLDLESILTNSFFQSEMAEKRISRGGRPQQPMRELIEKIASDTKAYVSSYEWPNEPERSAAQQLVDAVPDQQLGPVFFEFVSGKLRVLHQKAEANDGDKSNVEVAGLAIQKRGRALAESLAKGNCDRRVITAVLDMVERVKSKQDIIELGIANLAAQLVFQASESELADVVFAELQAFSVALSMYVAQFPQWVRFSENAASAEYTSADISRIYDTGSRLAEDLEKAKDAVDIEIPRTIRWMIEAIHNPRRAAKRAVFASIRTIENLISVILRTFTELLGSIKAGANAGTRRGITVAVAGALLLAAAQAGSRLAPNNALGLASGWVRNASGIVLKELEKK